MKIRIAFISVLSCSIIFLSCGKGEPDDKNIKSSSIEVNSKASKNLQDKEKKDLANFKGKYIKFRQVKVYDYNGFAKPVVAYTLLIPEGWKVTGGIKWNIYAKCITGFPKSKLGNFAEEIIVKVW